MTLRQLTVDDFEETWELGRIAFGNDPTRPADPESWFATNRRLSVGVFEAGRLVAQAAAHDYRQLYGGRPVPMGGVASVAVAPEARGRGHVATMMRGLLPLMRQRGRAVSGLFATAPQAYRGSGWEVAATLSWTRLRTDLLSQTRVDGAERVVLRPAHLGDVRALHELYLAAGRRRNAWIDRTGPRFPSGPEGLLSHDVVTVAEVDEAPVGYAAYGRGRGYDSNATLSVWEVVADHAAARAALLANIGSWSGVAPTARLRGVEPGWQWQLAVPLPPPEQVQPFMLRVVDLTAAVAARGWPPDLDATVDLDLHDAQAPWQSGRRRLVVSDGDGRLGPGGSGALRVHARALGPWFASYAGAEELRAAALLEGDAAAAAVLDRLVAGARPGVLDYF